MEDLVNVESEENFFGKIVKIDSGLYENGEGKLREYIDENYSNCKVCFVCESVNYLHFSNITKVFSCESIFLLSDDDATKKHSSNVKCVVENSSLFVCLDNESVDFAKYISTLCFEECLFYFEKMPTIDCFLPIRRSEENQIQIVNANPIKNYIICYFEPNELKREGLIESVFSCLSYLCGFLESVVNSILFKECLSEEFKCDFLEIAQNLKEFLQKLYFMPNDFLDNYLVFLEDFANFLVNQGWDYNTKENIFANIFKHICTKNDLNTNEIKIVGAQAFCRIYYEFFKNLDDMQFNYFDLKKRLELLEKYFQDVNFEIDNYSQLDIEKTTYILTKHKNKLFNKISSFMQMLEQILSSALDLYDDSGYLFSKKLNQDIALKAIYFTPDFLKGQSLLKIVRDFGVLDYL